MELVGEEDRLVQPVGVGDCSVPNHASAEQILQVVSIPGREFSFNQEEIIVGRDPRADWVMPCPDISRRRARR